MTIAINMKSKNIILSILFFTCFSITSTFSQNNQYIINVYFDFNQYTLTKENAERLSRQLEQFSIRPIKTLEINAFSDSIGNENGNLRIGELRINEVKNYITSRLKIPSIIENNYGSSYQRKYKLDSKEIRKIELIFTIIPKIISNEEIEETQNYPTESSIDYATQIKDTSAIQNQIDRLVLTKEENNNKPISVPKPVVNAGTIVHTFIYFEGDKSKYLYQPDGELQRIIEIATEHPDLKLLVKGHVCCGGTMKLSIKRAKRVYKDLIKKGIKKNRISYKGYGDTEPVADDRDESSRQKNRRVEILFY